MEGLSAQDLEVLGHYARQGNRERYWNYLAQHPGADGYGLLALGVVRNDNMPGAVTNLHAQNYAYSRNQPILTERGWEEFGQDLVRLDYARRAAYANGGSPELALNLPVKDVQDVHAEALARRRIDADAWTPNRLLDAARRDGGDVEMERAWHTVLDHGRLGTLRAYGPVAGIVATYGDTRMGQAEYLKDLGVAYASAASAVPQIDPDLIQRGAYRYQYNAAANQWHCDMPAGTTEPGALTPPKEVTDPRERADLDDARAVRMERLQKAQDVHPHDPYRRLAESPFMLPEASAGPSQAVRPPAARDVAPALYDELRPQLPAGMSEERLAQVTLAAKESGVRAGQVRHVLVENDTVYVAGRIPGMLGQVDLRTPAPPLQDTLQRSAALDRQQELQMQPGQHGPRLN